MARVQVAIVGAGPAGSTLALLLAQRGVEVALLERQDDFAREFRGEVLTPSGVQALREMGLSDLLDAVPTSAPQYADAFNDRVRFVRIPVAQLGDDAPLVVSQPHLLEAVVGRCATHAGFRFERGAAVTELLTDGGRVRGVRARNASGELDVEADLVVGADGRSSRVRREADLPVRSDPTLMDVVWCKLPLPDDFREASHVEFYIGNAHILVAYRAPDDLLQLGWVLRKGGWGELRSRGMDRWVAEMAAFVRDDLGAHLRAHVDDVSRPFLLSTASDRCTSWSKPGALLIGDAAHTCSPVGAQGLNIALRDAIVAANQLVPALRSGTSLDEAARRVEAERLPEVARIQRLQALPPRVIFSRSAWVQRLRGLTKLLRYAPVARIAARRGEVFANGVTDVRLRV